MSKPVTDRWKAIGRNVIEAKGGHRIAAIVSDDGEEVRDRMILTHNAHDRLVELAWYVVNETHGGLKARAERLLDDIKAARPARGG